MPYRHMVSTRHIQRLIENALTLAKAVDGAEASQQYGPLGGYYEVPRPEALVTLPKEIHVGGEALPEHLLCKAISDLRHAADELDAERLSCYGWKQH